MLEKNLNFEKSETMLNTIWNSVQLLKSECEQLKMEESRRDQNINEQRFQTILESGLNKFETSILSKLQSEHQEKAPDYSVIDEKSLT